MNVAEPQSPAEFHAQVVQLVDEMRSRCLWFLRPDYYPETAEEIDRTLRAIERNGDLSTFQCARTLRERLSSILDSLCPDTIPGGPCPRSEEPPEEHRSS